MTAFVAIVHKEAGAFGVSFADLPGCISAARTLEAAKTAAREALALHLAVMREDCAPIPPPSPLAAVKASPEYAEAFAFLTVEVRRPKRMAGLAKKAKAVKGKPGPGGNAGRKKPGATTRLKRQAA